MAIAGIIVAITNLIARSKLIQRGQYSVSGGQSSQGTKNKPIQNKMASIIKIIVIETITFPVVGLKKFLTLPIDSIICLNPSVLLI